MSATPMTDSMLRYSNDYVAHFQRWPCPKYPISPGAIFEVSPKCFHTLCTENPRVFVERKVFGIPVAVSHRLSEVNFCLNGGAA